MPNNVGEDPASYTPERAPVTMACFGLGRIVALKYCPLYTRIAKKLSTSVAEATMRPNPRRGAKEPLALDGLRGLARRLDERDPAQVGRPGLCLV